jgi:hypothetical protein
VPVCIELDLVDIDMLTLSHGVLSRRAISLSLSASRGSFFVGPRAKFQNFGYVYTSWLKHRGVRYIQVLVSWFTESYDMLQLSDFYVM